MPEQEDENDNNACYRYGGDRKKYCSVKTGRRVKDLQTIFGFATPQAIYKWQHGTAMPTIDNLVALAMIFDVTMDDIIVVDNDMRAQISA